MRSCQRINASFGTLALAQIQLRAAFYLVDHSSVCLLTASLQDVSRPVLNQGPLLLLIDFAENEADWLLRVARAPA